MVARFIAEAGSRGATRVTLTTDVIGNEAVNKFYQRLGFTSVRVFEARRGRLLNQYLIEIMKG